MSSVPTRNTSIEVVVRRHLHNAGLRFRINQKKLPGSPDIVLRKYKTAIFVHGCFWHGHKGCRLCKIPATSTSFWEDKLNRNRKRDRIKNKELRLLGWNTVIVWQCQIKKKSFLDKLVSLIRSRPAP